MNLDCCVYDHRGSYRFPSRKDLADFYGISDGALKARHEDLVQTLDVMPADYRYFTGKTNPLDKLVEAAQMLEQLETRFREA